MSILRSGLWVAAWILSMAVLAAPAHAKRVALVIGNAAYADMPLRNPVNDATDLSARLRQLGFEVTTLTDRNRSQMTQAIVQFGRTAQGAEAALFYFAGHGVQVRGKNYLLPVGQALQTEAEVEADAVDVNVVLARLDEAQAKVSLLILDACRTNPLVRSGRNSARGLARMEAPSGALVAFAAQPGAEAQDGTGRNGTFTKHLLAHIGTPGMPVEQVFKRVRADVERETGRRQSPREESSLTADFYFANPFTPVTPANRDAVEDAAWALCQNGNTRVPCDDYLGGWPQGRYAALARTRIQDLEAAAAAAAAAAAVRPQPDPVRPVPGPVVAGRSPGEVFSDCGDCPEMVVIGAGSFTMGSPAGETGRHEDGREGPPRQVRIGRAFALGRTEVTVGQWRRFVSATSYVTEAERNVGAQGCFALDDSDNKWGWRAGRTWRSPGFAQDDRHPVVCVSFNDVQAYVEWLNRTTGQRYRLPSEAEWEYAARAGTQTSRYWGDNPSQACGHANVSDQTAKRRFSGWSIHECDDRHLFTAPVRSYGPNGFSLHDMIGNVWEWVQDCYDEAAYGGKAPSDGRAYEVAGCSSRVLRGGSWFSGPAWARAADRFRYAPGFRSVITGFRLARMLP